MAETCPTCGRPYATARRAKGKTWPPERPGDDAPNAAVFAYYKATSCLEDAKFLLAHGAQYGTAEQEAELLHLIDELETRPSTSADRRTYHRISDQIAVRRNGTKIDEEGFWCTWRRYYADGRYSCALLREVEDAVTATRHVISGFRDLWLRSGTNNRQPTETEVDEAIGKLAGICTKVDRLIELGIEPRPDKYAAYVASTVDQDDDDDAPGPADAPEDDQDDQDAVPDPDL